MKKSILAAFTLAVMAVNFAAPSLADTKRGLASSRASELVALLPASDAVASMDARRFLSDALPKLLSGNQTLLGKMTAKVDEIQSKTGIDLRQFDSVAVGSTIKKISAKKFDFDPVAVARGQVNSASVISGAKTAANGKYREEKVGTRTLVVFTADAIAKRHQSPAADPKKAPVIDSVAGTLSREMAVTALDGNTVVLGSLTRVRETLAAKSRVSPELAGYLGRSDGAIIDFAGNVPEGMSALLPMENDELGRNIDSIRTVYGSMAMSGDTTLLNATAKTMQAEQARSLKDTLDGLQLLGKAFLGASRSADKQVYARMVENVRFALNGNEVSMALSVPQSDINVLVGMIK